MLHLPCRIHSGRQAHRRTLCSPADLGLPCRWQSSSLCRTATRILACFLFFFFFSLTTRSAEPDSLRKRLSINFGTHFGKILKADEYVSDFLKRGNNHIYNIAVGYRPLPSDSNRYASAFNYPTFTAGIVIGDFHQVRMHKESSRVNYSSHMGTVVGLYGAFNRRMFNIGNFSMDYALENGLAYGSRPYNPVNNVDNELIGSSFLFYFGAGLYMNYLIGGHLELSIGTEFKHFSNGALDRPNKGANTVGIGVRARYYFDKQPQRFAKLPYKPFKRHFYYNVSAGIAGKSLLDEWLLYYYNTPEGDPKYRTDHYKIYPAVTFSADAMYRYARRYGSGIGVDVFYTPYANRIKEIDETAGRDLKHDVWSVGIALKHEVYYKNLALSMSIGYYLHREMGYLSSEDEKPYYERLGLRYYFPKLGNIFIGYHVKAHLTKADFMEFCVGVQF